MVKESFVDIHVKLDSLSTAADEIAKLKGMIGLLLSYMPSDVQKSYLKRLTDTGLEAEKEVIEQLIKHVNK